MRSRSRACRSCTSRSSVPEPTDSAGGERPPEPTPAERALPAEAGGPPRQWLDYIQGRAPHLFTPDGALGAGWWWYAARAPRVVAPIAPAEAEPRTYAALPAPGEVRGPPRQDVARPVPPDATLSGRPRKLVPNSPAPTGAAPRETRRSSDDARAPRATRPRTLSASATHAPAARAPFRVARRPHVTIEAARSRPSLSHRGLVPQAQPSPPIDARARRVGPRLETTTRSDPQQMPPVPSEIRARPFLASTPNRDQWPGLTVEPTTRTWIRRATQRLRPRPHVPAPRETVLEPGDHWPSLPALDLAEPEPWRDLERQRVRDERIAHEQVSR